MDERLQKALNFSNFRLTLYNQKQNLKNITFEKFKVYENKGQFTANKETLSYINNFIDEKNSCIVLDDFENPIKITDIKKFYSKLKNLHTVALNEFYAEYERLARSRNLKRLLDLEDDE